MPNFLNAPNNYKLFLEKEKDKDRRLVFENFNTLNR